MQNLSLPRLGGWSGDPEKIDKEWIDGQMCQEWRKNYCDWKREEPISIRPNLYLTTYSKTFHPAKILLQSSSQSRTKENEIFQCFLRSDAECFWKMGQKCGVHFFCLEQIIICFLYWLLNCLNSNKKKYRNAVKPVAKILGNVLLRRNELNEMIGNFSVWTPEYVFVSMT